MKKSKTKNSLSFHKDLTPTKKLIQNNLLHRANRKIDHFTSFADLPVNVNLDNRFFVPDTLQRTIKQSNVEKLKSVPVKAPFNNILDKISYVNDKRVYVCQRRKTRREVLFASRKAGKGRGFSKKKRWTDTSFISCKG